MGGTIDERNDAKKKERERREKSMNSLSLSLLLSFWSGRLKNEQLIMMMICLHQRRTVVSSYLFAYIQQ
jgi:hypothetical protein